MHGGNVGRIREKRLCSVWYVNKIYTSIAKYAKELSRSKIFDSYDEDIVSFVFRLKTVHNYKYR